MRRALQAGQVKTVSGFARLNVISIDLLRLVKHTRMLMDCHYTATHHPDQITVGRFHPIQRPLANLFSENQCGVCDGLPRRKLPILSLGHVAHVAEGFRADIEESRCWVCVEQS